MEKRLWITPENDLEAVEIVKMLQEQGEEYLITAQAWGASWDGLEDEIKEKIADVKEGAYGIELQGQAPSGAKNIDHHIYGDDDRSNKKASIEQVAEVLGIELSIDQRFVAANDSGYIPAMEKLGKKLEISDGDIKEIINNVRFRDRETQGITKEQEAQAIDAISNLKGLEELEAKAGLVSMELPHSKCATVTDRLYGEYENLLIASGDGEVNFYGRADVINELNEKFPGGWSGGDLENNNGFWGGYPDQEAIKELVKTKIEKLGLSVITTEDITVPESAKDDKRIDSDDMER